MFLNISLQGLGLEVGQELLIYGRFGVLHSSSSHSNECICGHNDFLQVKFSFWHLQLIYITPHTIQIVYYCLYRLLGKQATQTTERPLMIEVTITCQKLQGTNVTVKLLQYCVTRLFLCSIH